MSGWGGYWVSYGSVVHRGDGPCRGQRHPWSPESAYDFDRACRKCLGGVLPDRGAHAMTPEQARRMVEAMTPDERARFAAFLDRICAAAARVDQQLTDAGQQMADEAEAWINQEGT